MGVFKTDAAGDMVSVQISYILMGLKKHFPSSYEALNSLIQELEEDPGKSVLGSSRSLWVAADLSLVPLKNPVGETAFQNISAILFSCSGADRSLPP